jgi:hypothetical protein
MAYLSVFPIPSESTQPMVLRIMARFGVLFLFAFATPLFADSVTINFEGFADGTVITTQYTGLGFLNATIATAGVSLDELDFPPHSGVNVVFDNGGPTTIDFSNPISQFSAYFTYSTALTVQGFNASNLLLQTANSLFSQNFVSSGNSPNELISLNTDGISSVVITGNPAGNSFVMDDLTFGTSVMVSEPVASLYMFVGLLFLLYVYRRKHRAFGN